MHAESTTRRTLECGARRPSCRETSRSTSRGAAQSPRRSHPSCGNRTPKVRWFSGCSRRSPRLRSSQCQAYGTAAWGIRPERREKERTNGPYVIHRRNGWAAPDGLQSSRRCLPFLRVHPDGLADCGPLRPHLVLILPELGDPAPVSDRDTLFEAVRGEFACLAREGHLVLLLDDLQWSDDATLELLPALARTTQPTAGADDRGLPLRRPAARPHVAAASARASPKRASRRATLAAWHPR